VGNSRQYFSVLYSFIFARLEDVWIYSSRLTAYGSTARLMTEIKRVYRDSDGVRRTAIWEDDNPSILHVKTEVDLTQAIENNKILRELHPRRSTNKLLARGVPLTVAERAIREQWDQRDWARWLDDPDNAAFRIWPGRVGK
jgi:hypothetical protein